ncbi:G patch domain-containing protein 4 [Colias croceus]|uniref:G patch domain-containing protein 4 n=1 Tax=Colias crocea TaxID=72248 RepID=UPI001E27E14A|nr:G patch domain-containing protein 4 [Colias croceus]
MDFARKQLEKYGWTDGKGLGKHENGISEALKPKLKRSVTGIGHDAAAEFTEHWWTKLYNTAASNVEVKEKNGKTKEIKTKDDEFEITNSSWSYKKKNKDKSKEEYTNFFVKTSILSNGGAKTEDLNDQGIVETVPGVKLSDEELFAACEGRTAHKGARHGLKALGKLARIEMQEQALLQQAKYKGYSQAKKDKNSEGDISSENDKKVKKSKNLRLEAQESNLCHENEPVKKVKRKAIDSDASSVNKNVELNEQNEGVNEIDTQDGETVPKKRKKKKKDKKTVDEEQISQTEDITETDVPKKSKKKKNKK